MPAAESPRVQVGPRKANSNELVEFWRVDPTYFRSIYYREPGGVLFEIATDPFGFAIDEPKDHLGERLMLPHQYEAQRAALERVLPRLTLDPSA